MLTRWREHRRARRAWREAWLLRDTPGEDGLSRFPREARQALERLFTARAVLAEWSRAGDDEPYLLAAVATHRLEVFLYVDAAELRSPEASRPVEPWEGLPEELIELLLALVSERIR